MISTPRIRLREREVREASNWLNSGAVQEAWAEEKEAEVEVVIEDEEEESSEGERRARGEVGEEGEKPISYTDK